MPLAPNCLYSIVLSKLLIGAEVTGKVAAPLLRVGTDGRASRWASRRPKRMEHRAQAIWERSHKVTSPKSLCHTRQEASASQGAAGQPFFLGERSWCESVSFWISAPFPSSSTLVHFSFLWLCLLRSPDLDLNEIPVRIFIYCFGIMTSS